MKGWGKFFNFKLCKLEDSNLKLSHKPSFPLHLETPCLLDSHSWEKFMTYSCKRKILFTLHGLLTWNKCFDKFVLTHGFHTYFCDYQNISVLLCINIFHTYFCDEKESKVSIFLHALYIMQKVQRSIYDCEQSHS